LRVDARASYLPVATFFVHFDGTLLSNLEQLNQTSVGLLDDSVLGLYSHNYVVVHLAELNKQHVIKGHLHAQ
jgi:hypothetical protein